MCPVRMSPLQEKSGVEGEKEEGKREEKEKEEEKEREGQRRVGRVPLVRGGRRNMMMMRGCGFGRRGSPILLPGMEFHNLCSQNNNNNIIISTKKEEKEECGGEKVVVRVPLMRGRRNMMMRGPFVRERQRGRGMEEKRKEEMKEKMEEEKGEIWEGSCPMKGWALRRAMRDIPSEEVGC